MFRIKVGYGGACIGVKVVFVLKLVYGGLRGVVMGWREMRDFNRIQFFHSLTASRHANNTYSES